MFYIKIHIEHVFVAYVCVSNDCAVRIVENTQTVGKTLWKLCRTQLVLDIQIHKSYFEGTQNISSRDLFYIH